MLAGSKGPTTYFDWLADPCDRPALITSGWTSDVQVESLWRQDPLALLMCGGKVEVVVCGAGD